MDMPKPTDHHLKLQKLAGHWQGETRMEMSPDGKTWSTFFDGTYEKK